MSNYEFDQGDFGERLCLTGRWTDDICDLMLQSNIKELEVNYAKGWVGDNLKFLELLPDLEGLRVTTLRSMDLKPIQALSSLRTLDLATFCKGIIDFTKLPRLTRCFLEWRPKSESIFGCILLEELYLNCFKGVSSSVFAGLRNLRSLTVANGPLPEIRGIAELANLEHLSLYNLRKLNTLEGIPNLHRLKILEVSGCKRISRIDEIGKLTTLEFLNICKNGVIESLKPLKNLHRLEELFFSETTNIADGDLSVLTMLPRLKCLALQNRRHYSHKREEFWQSGRTGTLPERLRAIIPRYEN